MTKATASSRSETDYDVAVVGQGPVGMTLAGLLGQQGLRVLAIDAAPDIYDLPRAIGLDQDVLRVFQQLGIADELAAFVSDYRPSEYRTANGEVIRRFLSQKPPYPLAWSPYATFLQPDLERVLRSFTSSLPTVELRLGTELTGLFNTDSTPTLTMRKQGQSEADSVTARFVVGCDGGNSYVRKTMGIAFEDMEFDQPWLVIDMLLNEPMASLPEVNVQYCNPDRPHTFVVGPRNLRRWEFMLLPGEEPTEMASETSVWNLLSPWLRPDQAKMWRSATYRFHALVAERWRKDSVFLAGDACHMTPPFLAQGMVQGIKDAANLAWKLNAACRGSNDDLLETYQEERRPLVKEVIEITKNLGLVIGERDPVLAEARNTRMRNEVAMGRGTIIRQDLFPPIQHGPICRHSSSGATAAGRPAPQPWILSDTGRVRLDDLTGRSLRVLAVPEFGVAPEHVDLAVKLGLELFVIDGGQGTAVPGVGRLLLEEDEVFRDWMKAHGARAIIVRPDNVVLAGLTEEDEFAPTLEHLKTFFGQLPC